MLLDNLIDSHKIRILRLQTTEQKEKENESNDNDGKCSDGKRSDGKRFICGRQC